MKVRLRPAATADIPHFLDFHSEEEGRRLAAFASHGSPEPEAFAAHWRAILANDSSIERTIVVDETVAGYVAHFEQLGRPSISYWIGRAWWGRGVASAAVAAFLPLVAVRPLFARVAKDNQASLRVLEKNGFGKVGEDQGFAAARGYEVEEWILSLG
ncbi:MAG TPA: GNAT family N-acetyltransferase [Allosphingosinicella sp.]|nr:GNAT family N-acetyltransferase [Allosphingosinicella sp.]